MRASAPQPGVTYTCVSKAAKVTLRAPSKNFGQSRPEASRVAFSPTQGPSNLFSGAVAAPGHAAAPRSKKVCVAVLFCHGHEGAEGGGGVLDLPPPQRRALPARPGGGCVLGLDPGLHGARRRCQQEALRRAHDLAISTHLEHYLLVQHGSLGSLVEREETEVQLRVQIGKDGA
eukprot:CAMPEP_0115179878 /NCGR_PEP_ID=MMETSP0270-20121206/6632_1 /TAXON_ID=71861 /ORGANISM="Scrippsiella trochoidea, Strain CCMP3099" /LENGTH=173 /DNA_ID=CAMNT_0002592863 /DNA_START=264 /DNA_END=785 /DNA_ORIENTATION=-